MRFVPKLCMVLLNVIAILTLTCNIPADTRNSLATAQGVIQSAQSQHQAECSANPSMAVCTKINELVRLQNVAIDGLETYCGWPARPTAAQLAAASQTPCTKNAPALTILTTALQNLNTAIADYKGSFPTKPGTGGPI
jgi:hypothetical protein